MTVASEELQAICDGVSDPTDANFAACEAARYTNEIEVGLDTFYLLFAAALVFLMQAGRHALCRIRAPEECEEHHA